MPWFVEMDGQVLSRFFDRTEAVEDAQRRSREIAAQLGVFLAPSTPREDPTIVYRCDFGYGSRLECVFRLKPLVERASPGGGAASIPDRS
jgi:hypothetical protein